MSTVTKKSRSGAPSFLANRGRTLTAKTKPEPPVHPGSVPLSNGSALHRNLKNHLLSASEVGFDEAILDGPSDDTFDLVSVARFPPPIAALLRRRLSDSFAQALQAWDTTASTAGRSDLTLAQDLSSRGALGLSIHPTSHEDYRVFDVFVDVCTQAELTIIQAWMPTFDIAKHPPVILQPKSEVHTESKSKAKAKSKGKAGTVEVSLSAKSTPPGSDINGVARDQYETPLGTIKLLGLLSELPAIIEAYKSLDAESMVKSCNVSQILVVVFPEDTARYFPAPLNLTGTDIHQCCERLVTLMENSEATDPDEILFDSKNNAFNLPRCPWLWPSGITPPLHLQREKRSKTTNAFLKQEVQAVEAEIISIMKKCPQERATVEVASALECYLQHEALQRDSSVPNVEQIVTLGPDSRLVHVITDTPVDIFDTADDSLVEQLFGEGFSLSESDLIDALKNINPVASNKKRKDRKPDQIQTATSLGSTVGTGGGGTTLEDEFDELAQIQARKQRADQLDQELEDEFYSEAVLEDNASSSILIQDLGAGTYDEDSAMAGLTSMKIITRDKRNKTKKK